MAYRFAKRNFRALIDGIPAFYIQNISALKENFNVSTYSDGTETITYHNGAFTVDNITLENTVPSKDPPKIVEDLIKAILNKIPHFEIQKEMEIQFLGPDKLPLRRWAVKGMVLISREIGDFAKDSDDLMMEKLEFAVRSIKEL